MQYETIEALNELVNIVSYGHKTIEYINSTNYHLIRQVKTLKELVHDLQ